MLHDLRLAVKIINIFNTLLILLNFFLIAILILTYQDLSSTSKKQRHGSQLYYCIDKVIFRLCYAIMLPLVVWILYALGNELMPLDVSYFKLDYVRSESDLYLSNSNRLLILLSTISMECRFILFLLIVLLLLCVLHRFDVLIDIHVGLVVHINIQTDVFV